MAQESTMPKKEPFFQVPHLDLSSSNMQGVSMDNMNVLKQYETAL